MSDTEWISATRQHPCPVCEKTDWCTITADRGTIHCRRGQHLPAPPGYRLAKRQPVDAARFVRDRDADALAYDPVIYRPAVQLRKALPPPARDWPALAGECATTAGDHIERLAADLGVCAESLRALGVGWNGEMWTTPNRDATGTAIGLATRAPGGGKWFVRGSRTGLVYDPDAWRQGDGPVLLVEGMSDTAALHGLGLAVIGRPSNTGGCDLLIEMLAEWPDDRGIVVVGEHDQKDDGSWPGRTGAISTAERLADQLHRDIAWTMPPEAFKDSRAFVRSGADAEAVVFAYADAAKVVRGTPRPPHEIATADTTTPRSLVDYRAELHAAKPLAIATPGVCVDRAPTGAGKTLSTIEALLGVGDARSVTALPTHQNIRERYAEMLDAGHAPGMVGVMPELTPENCKSFVEASAARAAGMSHGITICPSCPHQKGCEYARQAELAKRRTHLLTTAEHFRRSWSTEDMQKRGIVIVDEKPDETLAPMIECPTADLTALAEFLDAMTSGATDLALRPLAEWNPDEPPPPPDASVEAAQVADHLALIARAAIELAEGMTDPGVASRSIEFLGSLRDGWERRMVSMLSRMGATPPPPDAMRLVVALASGMTDAVWASADRLPNGTLRVYVFVHWRVELDGKRVLLLDGTADIGQLGKLTGGAVQDITPTGRLENVHAVTQRPLPIAMNTPPGRVMSIVAAVMDDLDQYPRVGLIGHKKTIEALMSDGEHALPAAARERIVKHSWFGHGPDRASNEWHDACDVLLVVGTPRPNPGSIRRRLVVQGDIDAASLPDGTWDDGTWDATTVAGESVTLRSRGYTHPEWRAAHQAMVRAALRQAIGRARAGLVEGIPCVVLSDEPLGLPVDRRPVLVHRKPAQRVLEALRGIQAAAQAAYARGEAEFTIETLVAGGCITKSPPMPIRYRNGEFTLIGIGGELVIQAATAAAAGFICALPPAVIGTAADVTHGRITEAITDLANAGDIHQPEPGYWALGTAPTEPGTVYARILPVGREAGTTGIGRPPEVIARATAAQDAIARVAATGNGICTTGQFVAAEAAAARATAMRKLAAAVQAGAVEQMGRGKYVPGPGALYVAPDGKSAVQWSRMETDAGPVPVEITHTITSVGGTFSRDYTPPNAAQLAALAEWRKKPIQRRT